MASFRNLDDPDVNDFLDRVAEGTAGQDPQAQTLARSTNNQQAAAVGRQMLAQQAQQQAAQQAANQRLAEQAAEQQAKQAAADQAQRQAASVRAAAAAGMQETTDIATGKKTIATDPKSGQPLWKVGAVAPPRQVPAVNDAMTTVPGLGDLYQHGHMGMPVGYEPANGQATVQDWRNAQGQVQTRPVPTKTDMDTGNVTTTGKDAFGAPTTVNAGTDFANQAAAMRKAELDQRHAQIQARETAIGMQKAQFEPLWKPIDDDATAAGKELAGFDKSPKFTRQTNSDGTLGKWVKMHTSTGIPMVNNTTNPEAMKDPDTGIETIVPAGQPFPYDKRELTNWQAKRAYLESVNAQAQAKRGKYQPAYDQLTAAKAKIDQERRQHTLDLLKFQHPGIDDTSLDLLASAQTGQPSQTAQAFDAVTGLPAAAPPMTGPPAPQGTNAPATPSTGGASSASTPTNTKQDANGTVPPVAPLPASKPQPLIPLAQMDDPAKLAAASKLVGGLVNPQELQTETSPAGVTTVSRKTKQGTDNVGFFSRDSQGNPMFELSSSVEGSQLRHHVDFSATDGVPVYLQSAPGTETHDPIKGAQYVASVMAAVKNVTDNPGSYANPQAANDAIKTSLQTLQATPDQISAQVRTGQLAVQQGQAVMKNVWGMSLQPDDPSDPKLFHEWFIKQPADVQKAWKNSTTPEESNPIKAEYIKDWIQNNAWKPGMDQAFVDKTWKEQLPGRAPEGQLETIGRNLVMDTVPAIGTAVGKFVGGILGIESGPGAVATATAGGMAGSLIATKAQKAIFHATFGENAMKEMEYQQAANRAAHPDADTIGTMVPLLISCIGNPVGAGVRTAEGQLLGRALTASGKAAIVASKGAPWAERVAQNWATGLRVGGGSKLRDWVNDKTNPDGSPITPLSVLNSMAREGVTFGSLGFAPEAIAALPITKNIFVKAGYRSVSDSALMATSGVLYDALTTGTAPDWARAAEESKSGITPFFLQNLVMGALHRSVTGMRRPKAPGAPEGEAPTIDTTRPTPHDPAAIAAMPEPEYRQWIADNSDVTKQSVDSPAHLAAVEAGIAAARERGDNHTADILTAQLHNSKQPTDTQPGGEDNLSPETAQEFNRAGRDFNQALAATKQRLGIESAPPAVTGDQNAPAGTPGAEAGAPAEPTPVTLHPWASREIGEYAAAPPEGKPSVQDAVTEAFANNQAVHASMAKRSGIETPPHYEKQGNLLVPNRESRTPAPAAHTPAPASAAAQPHPESREGNHPVAVANRIKDRVEAALPKTKGRIDISHEDTGDKTGGASFDPETGRITLHIPDIASHLNRFDPKAVEDSITRIGIAHEAAHMVQPEAVKAIWKAAGSKGDFQTFFQDWYRKMGSELSPEAVSAAREIYGPEAWDALADSTKPGEVTYRQSAETARMLLEAAINPDPAKANQFSELFRALKLKQSKTLIDTIRQAVETMIRMVKSGELPASWKEHIGKLEELYRDLACEKAEPKDEPKPEPPAASEKPPEAKPEPKVETDQTITSVKNPDGTSNIMENGRPIESNVPANEVEATLKKYRDAGTDPVVIAGQAITAANESLPSRLPREKYLELSDMTDQLGEVMKGMPPAERRPWVDQQIADWLAPIRAEHEDQAQRSQEARDFRDRAKASRGQRARAAVVKDGLIDRMGEFGMLAPAPNLIGADARRRAGKPPTNEDILARDKSQTWDGIPLKSMFKGQNATLVGDVIDLYTARPGEGIAPDDMAAHFGMDLNEFAEALDKELRQIAYKKQDAGKGARNMSDEQIGEMIDRMKPAELAKFMQDNPRMFTHEAEPTPEPTPEEQAAQDANHEAEQEAANQRGENTVRWQAFAGEDTKVGEKTAARAQELFEKRWNEHPVDPDAETEYAWATDALKQAQEEDAAKSLPIAEGKDMLGEPLKSSPAPEMTKEEKKEAFDSAVRMFGLTRDIAEAGYILPDGRLLDFTGRNQTGEYERQGDYNVRVGGQRDWMKKQRGVDHREIEWDGMPEFKDRHDAMIQFMRMGAVRIDQSGAVTLHGREGITAAQKSRLADLLVESKGNLNLDMEDDSGKRAAISLEGAKIAKVAGYIQRWKDGWTPDDIVLRSSPVADDPEPFYSKLERVVGEKIPNNATPDQIIGTLTGAGVKADEIKWSGIIPKLQELAKANGGKVPKGAVTDFLANEGKVRFQEVTHGATKPLEWTGDGTNFYAKQGRWDFRVEKLANGKYRMQVPGGTASLHDSLADAKTEAEDIRKRVGQDAQDNPTKFGQYQLPGGENYREVVLTKPTNRKSSTDGAKEYYETFVRKGGEPSWDDLSESKRLDVISNTPEQALTGPAEFTSSHFGDIPNYVAHGRWQDRTLPDGKTTLHSLENQNDASNQYLAARQTWIDQNVKKDAKFASLTKEQQDAANAHARSVIPDTPFQGNPAAWIMAMFKRQLRTAVAEGKNAVSWDVGDTVADRFDLSKQIGEIHYNKTREALTAYDHDHKAVISQSAKPEDLPDIIGKDMAQKLFNEGREPQSEVRGAEHMETYRLKGQDLKVGGEDKRLLYDQIMPKEIAKYVKQWGAKVERSRIDVPTDPKSKTSERPTESKPIWKVEITPDMERGVKQGQALFSSPVPDEKAGEKKPTHVIDRPITEYSKPANQYTYEPHNETDPRIKEIHDFLGIQSVTPHSDSGTIRELSKTFGTNTRFYRGGKQTTSGFTSPEFPNEIFINADHNKLPVGWTIAHEIVHVAQKDSRTNSQELVHRVFSQLKPQDIARINEMLDSNLYKGASPKIRTAEAMAFLTADSLGEYNETGLDWNKPHLQQVREALQKWFHALGELKPDAKPGEAWSHKAQTGDEGTTHDRTTDSSKTLGTATIAGKTTGSIQGEDSDVLNTPDLATAANAPDATQKLGDVKVGTMSALGAYRTLTAKRERTGGLTDAEQTKLDAASKALDERLTPPTDATGQMRLLSSPAPDDTASQQAIRAVLDRMGKRERDIYQDAMAGMPVPEIVAKHKVSEKGINNILNHVSARTEIALSAASPDGLKPVMRGDKFVGKGAKYAGSTVPEIAAIHQIRETNSLPGKVKFDEIHARAKQTVDADPIGAVDHLIDKRTKREPYTLEEAAQAQYISRKMVLSGEDNTTENRVKIGMLTTGYIDYGTDVARSLAIRVDSAATPAERHAQCIAGGLYMPNDALRKQMRNSKPEVARRIMEKWVTTKTDRIKAELLSRGIDIDASLKQYRESEAERQQAAEESPRTQKAIDETFAKLTKHEKIVINSLKNPRTSYEGAAKLSGLSLMDAMEVYRTFKKGIATAMKDAAKRYDSNSLAASPARGMVDDILLELGYRHEDDIPKTDADRARMDEEKAQKRRQSSGPRKPKAPGEPKAPAGDPNQTNIPLEGTAADATAGHDGLFIPEGPKKGQQDIDLHGTSADAGDHEGLFLGDTVDKKTVMSDKKANWKSKYTTLEDGTMLERQVDKKGNVSWKVTSGTFDLNDPIAVKHVLDAFGAARGGWGDKMMDFWRMSVLTGLQTIIVNASSHSAHALWKLVPRRVVEATINNALGLVGQSSPEGATFGEFKPMAKALGAAFHTAARMALTSWKLGGLRTLQAYMEGKAIDLQSLGVGGEYLPPVISGKIGDLMSSISYKPMASADEYIKSVYGVLHTAAISHRMARVQEGLTGPAYEARLNELMQPGSEAAIRAMDDTQRTGFQEELDGKNPQAIYRLDQASQWLKKMRREPYIGKPLSFIIPFVDTPTNLAKLGMEMTPLNGFLIAADMARSLKRRMFNGDIPKEEAIRQANEIYDRVRLVKDITNQTMAWAAFLAIRNLISSDNEDGLPWITGTTSYTATKRGERDNANAVMPPMSIRLGNAQFRYNRMEPFAIALATAADLAHSNEQQGGFGMASASETAAKFKDQMKEKTFLYGITNLITAFEQPERFTQRMAGGILTGFVPNLIRQTIRESDTQARNTYANTKLGWWDSLAKTVGYQVVPQFAPQKIDVWGRPVMTNRGDLIGGTRPTDLAMHIFDPSNLTINPHILPIDRWIFRWNHQVAEDSNAIGIQPIKDTIEVTDPVTKKRTQVPLSEQEHEQANIAAGQMALKALGEGWESKPLTEQTAKLITQVVAQCQSAQRKMLLAKKTTQMQDAE